MTHDEYTALPGVNWSRLKLMARSARHYRDGYEAASADSAARRIGRLFHLLTLEPERAASAVAVWAGPGTRATKAYKEWAASLPVGVEIVTQAEYDVAAGIADSVREHPVASVLLSHGEAEVTLVWQEDGIPLKGRADWLIRSATPEQAAVLEVAPGAVVLVDLKTCGSVAAHAVARDAARMMYHGQLAHYAAGAAHECGRPVDVVALINAESKIPHDVAVDVLPADEAMYGGELLRRSLLDRLRACIESDEWPGTAPELRTMTLPAWAPGWEHDTDDETVIILED